jgi:hypothetical protein
MLRREVESDAVAGVAKERLSRGHRVENAVFAFLAEIVVDATELSDEAHDAFGHVGIEVVADDAPRRGRRRGGEQALHKGNEVLFGAGIADGATDRTGRDVERRDQGFGAVPDVLELPPFDVPGLHRQALRRALQCLDSGHLVDRNGLHTLFRSRGRRLIDIADASTLRIEVGVWFGGQPVADAMWFKVRFFLKSVRPSHARCFRRYRVALPAGPVRSDSNG